MSGVIEKVKDALHLNKDHQAHGTTGTTAGTTHTGTTHTSTHSTTGYTGNTGSTNAGPHDSNVANKLDPRVDSDRDGSHNVGGTTGTSGYGNTGVTGNSGYGNSGTTGNSGYGSTNAGPHDSNIANKLDPRVDSDHDGSRNVGGGYSGTHTGNNNGFTGTGAHGGISNSTNAGPHNSNMANKLDPRVDSDLDGKGNRHGASSGGVFGASGSHATPGSGTAQNTAGPHNSDLLNKLDPRVDSNLDGSRTSGGNATRY